MRQGLSKQDQINHLVPMFLYQLFLKIKRLDPKRTLAFYLKRTEQFRKLLKGKDETNLFLSLNAISRWIVNTIKMSYDDNIKVRGHSTCLIGPSWALFNGASMSAILNSADWKSESTFTKYYLKNVYVPVLKVSVYVKFDRGFIWIYLYVCTWWLWK